MFKLKVEGIGDYALSMGIIELKVFREKLDDIIEKFWQSELFENKIVEIEYEMNRGVEI